MNEFTEAYKKGYLAGLAGKSEDKNAYAPSDWQWREWADGWYAGFSELQAPESL